MKKNRVIATVIKKKDVQGPFLLPVCHDNILSLIFHDPKKKKFSIIQLISLKSYK
jgi:hypothetical protein